MGRAPCCDKAHVKKGPWSPEEDRKLKEYIQTHGTGGNWIALPQKAGLRRCGKSCRLRWLNYLRPNIKHGEFSDDEDKIICTLFASIGSRWSIMAAQLPGRTDNDIKNYWNTKLKKKMMNSLISMPPPPPHHHHHHHHHEIRKKQPLHDHHHRHLLQSAFNSSTNYYSYPSLSIFQNNASLSSSPSPSPPSSYVYSTTNTNTSSSYHDQTTQSIQSISPAADHGYLDSGLIQGVVKDSSTLQLLMFGAGGDKSAAPAAAAAASTSNSDGSCHYNDYAAAAGGDGVYYDHHHHHHHDNNNNNNKKMGNLKSEEFDGGDPSLDSCLEEIKQLITTNLCSSSDIINDNSLNFFVDETKEDVDKLMYY